jgi:hypothetical protein
MPTGSVLELYTSVLAWNLYGAIWGLLVTGGLVLIPFIATIIKVLIDTRDSAMEISAEGLVRILETRLYPMLFVVFMAAQPMIYVQLSKTTYTHYRCEASATGVLEKTATEKSFGDSGSTLDKQAAAFSVMLDGKTPEAPFWWYLVTLLNHAISQSAKQELPCQADLRTMVSGLSELDVPDKNLKDELGDFYNQCWKPAVNIFGSQRLPDSELPSKFRDGAIYDDIAWPGSEFFLSRAGFYDTLKTSTALSPEHFPYSESRDAVKIPPPPSGVDVGGFPTCHEWWLGYPKDGVSLVSDHGLRTRLLKNVKDNGADDDCGDCTGAWWNLWADDKFATTVERDNTLIKTALFNTKSSMELNLGNGLSGGGDNLGSDTVNAVQTGIAFLGAALTSVPNAIETESYRKIAPALQAITLMIFIVVLPILLTLGSFSLGNLVTLSILQFSIIFWSFLFAFAAWLDNFLLDSLLSFGDDGRTVVGYVFPDAIHNPDAMAISWVVRMCYWLLPLLFTYFLGAIGHQAGTGITSALNKGGIGAAGQSSGLASKWQNNAISKAKSLLRKE